MYAVNTDPLGAALGILHDKVRYCKDEQDIKGIAHKYALDSMLEGWSLKVLAIDRQESGVRLCRATYIMPNGKEIINPFSIVPIWPK